MTYFKTHLIALAILIYSIFSTTASLAQKRAFTIQIVNPAENKSIYNDSLVSHLNAFAFDLYKGLNPGGQNLFISPYSISNALALAFLGSKGQTSAQFHQVLAWDTAKDKFGSMISRLNQEIVPDTSGKGSQLDVANAVWLENSFHLLPDYMANTQKYLGASVNKLNFVSEPEVSRQTINKWVENKTNSRIKNFIPEGAIKTSTRVVLTNAVHYLAKWKKEFDIRNTQNADFYVTPSQKVEVSFMSNFEDSYHYFEDNYIKAIEIPYQEDRYSAVLLLPVQNGGFLKVWDYMNNDSFENIIKSMYRARVDVTIPKFTFETGVGLNDALKNVGLEGVFSPGADFSGMTGSTNLCFDAVIHKTFIEVNEKGTEAAAATGVFMRITSVDPRTIKKFMADHPFIFIIKDNKTQTILFIGQVFNPAP